MTDFHARALLTTDTVAVWDVVCEGTCRHKSTEECVAATHLVFPYRGTYVQHTGRAEAVAEPNQIVFINEDEAYRVSHPVEGGDASLSIRLDTPTLLELVSADYLQVKGRPAFNRSRLRLDAHVQVLTALVRHRLSRGVIETLEAESLALELLRRALSGCSSRAAAGSIGRRKLVDRAKLVLIGRIVATIDVPVTVDFEGGYSKDEGELSDNISRLLELGAIGTTKVCRSARRLIMSPV